MSRTQKLSVMRRWMTRIAARVAVSSILLACSMGYYNPGHCSEPRLPLDSGCDELVECLAKPADVSGGELVYYRIPVRVTNPLSTRRFEDPVVLTLGQIGEGKTVVPSSIHVIDGAEELPYQVDDMDLSGDASGADEVVFTPSLGPNETKMLYVYFQTSRQAGQSTRFPSNDSLFVCPSERGGYQIRANKTLLVIGPRASEDELRFVRGDGSISDQLLAGREHGVSILVECGDDGSSYDPYMSDVFDIEDSQVKLVSKSPIRSVLKRDLHVSASRWSRHYAAGQKANVISRQTWAVYPDGRIYLAIRAEYVGRQPSKPLVLGWMIVLRYLRGRPAYQYRYFENRYFDEMVLAPVGMRPIREKLSETTGSSLPLGSIPLPCIEFSRENEYAVAIVPLDPFPLSFVRAGSDPRSSYATYLTGRWWQDETALKPGTVNSGTIGLFLHDGGAGSANVKVEAIRVPIEVSLGKVEEAELPLLRASPELLDQLAKVSDRRHRVIEYARQCGLIRDTDSSGIKPMMSQRECLTTIATFKDETEQLLAAIGKKLLTEFDAAFNSAIDRFTAAATQFQSAGSLSEQAKSLAGAFKTRALLESLIQSERFEEANRVLKSALAAFGHVAARMPSISN